MRPYLTKGPLPGLEVKHSTCHSGPNVVIRGGCGDFDSRPTLRAPDWIWRAEDRSDSNPGEAGVYFGWDRCARGFLKTRGCGYRSNLRRARVSIRWGDLVGPTSGGRRAPWEFHRPQRESATRIRDVGWSHPGYQHWALRDGNDLADVGKQVDKRAADVIDK